MLQQSFGRKLLSKHGWNFFMIEKRVTQDSQLNASTFSVRSGNENKRATTLFNLRENSAGGLEHLLDSKDAHMAVIVESNEGTQASPGKAQTPQSGPFVMAGQGTNGQENLESTPRIQMHMAPGYNNTATRASQSVFVSPCKKTVMKRAEINRDQPVHGNVVVSAVYTRGFKVLYSLTQHTYPNGIDTMF